MKERIILFVFFCFLLFSNLCFAQNKFNIEVNLPNSYKVVAAGNEIWFTTKLISLGNQGRIDITLKYDVLDSNNNIIISKSQTLAVETQASFVGHILIPEDLDLGKYSLKVLVHPTDFSLGAESQTTFDVVEKEINVQADQQIYLFLVFLLVMAILVYIVIKLKPSFMKIMVRMQVHKIVTKKQVKRILQKHKSSRLAKKLKSSKKNKNVYSMKRKKSF